MLRLDHHDHAGEREEHERVELAVPRLLPLEEARREQQRQGSDREHEQRHEDAEPVDVDEKAFDDIVGGAKLPVFVDFWAEWCGPCRRVAPEVKKLAARLAGKAVVLKVDTDAQANIAGRFAIRSIPTFIVFKNGKVVVRESGSRDESGLAKLVERAA